MSPHIFSESTISYTKLCIKNNFLLKFMFSTSCFSPSTVYCLVSPVALFLLCWILSLPLSPPAYFPQRSTTFNNIHRCDFCYLTLWFFTIPTALQSSVLAIFMHSMPLSIHFLFLASSLASFLRRLFGFLNARLSYQFPPRSLSFRLCLLASLAS